jgi:hypothetical protein
LANVVDFLLDMYEPVFLIGDEDRLPGDHFVQYSSYSQALGSAGRTLQSVAIQSI